MNEILKLHYVVDGNNFSLAGQAASDVKKMLKTLGMAPDVIRRVSIAMYEGEINMGTHAGGGVAEVLVSPDSIEIILTDHGPGIPDIDLAMQEGYSTAPDTIRSIGFGAGMGLPNMKKYTDEMVIESQVQKGTRVFMRVDVK